MPFPENLGDRQQRTWLLGLLIVAFFALMAGRLVQMQLVNSRRYAELARDNAVRNEPIPALRGSIYDREGRLLAGNRASFDLCIDTRHPVYRDRERLRVALHEAARQLGRDPQELEQRAERYRGLYGTMLMERDLDQAALAPFLERLHPIPGQSVDPVTVRWNPHGTLGAHVLGYLGEVSEEEIRRSGAGRYRRGQLTGRAGLERKYEPLLCGTDGETYVEVDALGRKTDLFPDLPPVPPVAGADLHVTLDQRLQEAAEQGLAQARDEHGGIGVNGAVVALDPWTGEVLVCASAPVFDPNAFTHGLTAQQWTQINAASHPLLNRVIQAGYPPASVFKIVTSLAGIDGGVVTRETRPSPCYGRYTFGNRTFRCWKKEGHGSLDMKGAFEQSCDVYYYQVGRALGVRRLTDYAASMGLGALTEIDLPEEREGLIPTYDWYKRRLGGAPPEGNVLSLAIGQAEITLTPLQIAAFVGGLVTDGVVRRPHVAQRAIGPGGHVVWEYGPPQTLRVLPVPAELRLLARELFEVVVEGGRGTGSRARVKGFRVGGKTGTAQNPHGGDHALFVGIAPMERPEIVVVAVGEGAGHGGSVAAPIAHAVLKAYLEGPPVDSSAVADGQR